MTHLGYILAAYCAAFAVLGGLAAWVIGDLRRQTRRLKTLQEQGLARRSGSVTQ
jgi:heme exporter protein CcmD